MSLAKIDWNNVVVGSVSEAVENTTRRILAEAEHFIPKRVLVEQKGAHRWINDACRESVWRKNDAEKTFENDPTEERHNLFMEACEESSQVLGEHTSIT